MRVLAGEAGADAACAQLAIEQHDLPGVVAPQIGYHIGQRRLVVAQPAAAPRQSGLTVYLLHRVAHGTIGIGHLLVRRKNLLWRVLARLDPYPPG